MTLQLYTLSKERPGDFKLLTAIARIHYAAWRTIPLVNVTWYGPESSHAEIIDKYVKGDTHSLQNEDALRFIVVIDDQLQDDNQEDDEHARSEETPRGRIIAALKYYVVPGEGPHPDSGTQEVIDNPDEPVEYSAIENNAMSHVFVGAMVAIRQHAMEILGTHVVIDNIYTDPTQQRRGAGAMLMRHACEEADELGLPCMLEASPAGMKVYESAGFRQADWPGAEIWMDLKRWVNGGDKGQEFEDERLRADPGRRDGWYAQIVMVRPKKVGDENRDVPLGAGEKSAVVV